MTFRTDENPVNFRYRIYWRDKMIGATDVLLGARGFVRALSEDNAENAEYAGSRIVVKDTFLNQIVAEEGGNAKTADILPFPRR